jgi:hypothetical protein
VVIKSDPSGADVLENGKRIGKTPYETTLPIDAASTPYTLRLAGYDDEVVSIKHTKDYEAITHLGKKPAASTSKSGGSSKTTKTTKTGGGSKSGTGSTKTTPSKPCQKRGGPIQPFGEKLPLCPE